MNMSLTKELVQNFFNDSNLDISDNLNILQEKENSFFKKNIVDNNSIEIYPENIEELINQLQQTTNNKYNKETIDRLRELLNQIENTSLEDDIPVFNYTL